MLYILNLSEIGKQWTWFELTINEHENLNDNDEEQLPYGAIMEVCNCEGRSSYQDFVLLLNIFDNLISFGGWKKMLAPKLSYEMGNGAKNLCLMYFKVSQFLLQPSTCYFGNKFGAAKIARWGNFVRNPNLRVHNSKIHNKLNII